MLQRFGLAAALLGAATLAAANTYTVTSVADSGAGTLRQAIASACVTATFTDVPCSSPFAPWIYELVDRNITASCGGGNYCPTTSANRGQMAAFLVNTFSLP